MTENLEQLKRQQTRIDLLTIQKEQADTAAHEWSEKFYAQLAVSKNLSQWNRILFVLLVIFFAFIIYTFKQYGDLRQENENLQQNNLIKRNGITAAESFAVKYINQADSVFDGLLLTSLDTASLSVPGTHGSFFKLLIIKNK